MTYSSWYTGNITANTSQMLHFRTDADSLIVNCGRFLIVSLYHDRSRNRLTCNTMATLSNYSAQDIAIEWKWSPTNSKLVIDHTSSYNDIINTYESITDLHSEDLKEIPKLVIRSRLFRRPIENVMLVRTNMEYTSDINVHWLYKRLVKMRNEPNFRLEIDTSAMLSCKTLEVMHIDTTPSRNSINPKIVKHL